MNVAFIGLGNMGSPMARNLLRAGHRVTVYNRTRAKAEALAAEGAIVSDSPAHAVERAEAVLTMLANDDAVEETVWGPNGFGSSLARGAVHISHSTIGTVCSRRLAYYHQGQWQGYLSVPVFGRPEAAQNKKLVVVAAGEQSLIDRFRPLFEAMGRCLFIAGPEPWQANAIKVCGNLMIMTLIETFGETFAAMRKSNLDPHLFLDVANEVFGSPVYKSYGATIVDERFDPPGFALKHGLKDIRLALELAEDRNAPLPLASLIRDQFLSALAHGDGEIDTAALARVAARSAGL
ncbi:MAG TPA: NAD(P)-dependent oxidoreductase [Bryobacteraceae bacterium]|nr:NAD(P)-dependent oxidoreductase [Bryobacteraceae bacterium]